MIWVNTLDNNGNVTFVLRYNTAVATGDLIGKSGTVYDVPQRPVPNPARYAVTVGTGVVGSNVLTDNTWFNALNRPVKSQPAGS